MLTAFFIVDGLLTIVLAIEHRRKLSGRWAWMMVNGVIDLILAGIIIAGFPGMLVWAFGLLLGIDMLFGAASLIAMALQARNESEQHTATNLFGGRSVTKPTDDKVAA